MTVVGIHLLAGADVVQRTQVSTLINGDVIPIARIIVPTVVFVFGPCVEIRRQHGLVAVGHATLIAGAYFGAHEEVPLVQAFVAILLAQSLEGGNINLVERQARDMATGVDTEAVNAHLNE